MAVSLVKLRPNKKLLDHDFEGYKLNLLSLAQYDTQLNTTVDRLYPDEVQYSFVHAKLFAFHNHLIFDVWDHQYNFYYIDNQQQVVNVTFDNINNSFQTAVVFAIPAHVERKPGHFNPCLTFPSSKLALVSDGAGFLHMIDTGTRNRPAGDKKLWNITHSTLALGKGKYFIIVDSRRQKIHCADILHCLLQSVEQNENHFDTVLTWLSFQCLNGTWKQIAIRQVSGKGIVHYAAFETECDALYIASDNTFQFTMDSVTDITAPKKKTESNLIIYSWLQTADDITITLKLEEDFDKNLLSVNVTPLSLKISYAGKEFVNGKLEHKIDSDLTTWNIQDNGEVDILVTKSESNSWNELFEGGDKNGHEILDLTVVDKIHQRLAHLCSETDVTPDQPITGLVSQELEECDAASEEHTVLVRLEASNHEVTHRVPLSVNHYLFSLKLETHEAPAVVLRHDVDAYVWQPFTQPIDSNIWQIKHYGTLMAFGYVQSSKTNRKFVTCSPNLSYSVVCEAERHIFIYKSAAGQENQLRRRDAGVMKPVKIGHQHVVNIDRFGEVVGVHATNDYLFVLTEKTLVAICV